MTRTRIVSRVLLCILALLVSMSIAIRAVGAQAVPPTPPTLPLATAATETGACARIDVLLMVDESASLDRTDPDDRRVDAAEVLVRSLAGSAEASGVPVDVTVAGFGSEVQEIGRASLPADTDAAVDAVRGFADRTGSRNTDYLLALGFAVDHVRSLNAIPAGCTRLVWFTDGAYSIDDPAAKGIAGYTASTDPAVIESELEGQLCGPLPTDSRLGSPIAEQLRESGLTVQLVDLRSAGGESAAEQAERAVTGVVIDRLLTSDPADGCRVPGGRVEAGRASDLAGQFFAQGQLALGRRSVPCETLAAGAPAALVRATTVRGVGPAQGLQVTVDGGAVATGSGFVTWAAAAESVSGATGAGGTSGSGAQAGTGSGTTVGVLRAGAADGSTVDACFVDLAASIVPVGSQRIDPAAAATTLSWAVLPIGAGASSARGDAAARTRLGPDQVAVTATIGGGATPVAWDDATRTWQLVVAGPQAEPPVVDVRVDAPGWGEVASVSSDLQAGVVMAPPTVEWRGPTRLEGSGTFEGMVHLTPAPVTAAAQAPDGVVCLNLGDGSSSGVPLTVRVDQGRSCHSAGESFEVPVTLVVNGDQNAELAVVVPYTVTHLPTGGGEESIVASDQVDMPTIVLAKPASALTSALVTAGIVLVSTVVPLVLLVVLMNLQRRLPPPSQRRVVRVALTAVGGEVRLASDIGVHAADLGPVAGNRDLYELPEGLSLVRPRTRNPFAPMIVELHSDRGPVSAVPWMAPGAGRTVQVPSAFTFLVVIRNEPGSDVALAVVVAPADASTDDVDRAVRRALVATNELWSRVSSVLPEMSEV